ncbi:SURF1 family protein [Marinimicrobium alkaliphilum]|uniref:SURF1 family protein n=1 Tax=Marinimicrobium alkaliphilum TaxID=2202654 RepID=UPI001300A3CF|nr:SURF1 family protein [Marinimicrobium alkaliphilum]
MTSEHHPVRLRLAISWKITLLTLLALPLLLSLGFWQLDRAAEKRALEAAFDAQRQAPPVELTRAEAADLARYQRVIVRGEFDNEHTWLLDNKQRSGRVGYEVVTPLVLEDGARILVNRGWIPSTGNRQQLPEVPAVAGERTLFAQVAEVSDHPMLDAHSDSRGWPKVILQIEPVTMGRQLGQRLAPFYLLIDDNSAGAFETRWQAVNMSTETHIGYAVQWFAMALALSIWFVFANSNVLAWWRSRRKPAINRMTHKR